MAFSDREPFEAYVRSKISNWGTESQEYVMRTCVISNEIVYEDPTTQMRWEAWQESRNLDFRSILLTIILLVLVVIVQGYFLLGYDFSPTLVFNTKPTWTLMNYANRGGLFDIVGSDLVYHYAGTGGWVLRCMNINAYTGIVEPVYGDAECSVPYVKPAQPCCSMSLHEGDPSEHSNNPKP